MRILVDARHLRSGGIGRFLRGVVGPWIGREDVEELRLLGPPEALRAWIEELGMGPDVRSRTPIVPWTDPMYSARAQARWALRLHSSFDGVDAAFFPHYDTPLLRHPAPSVVTVHDLTQFLLPEHYPRRKRWVGRRLLEGSLARADRVVTVSERSRDDLVRHTEVEPERIVVVPDGVDETFRPLDEAEREGALGRWGTLLPFLLVVGPDRPHKNLAFAVEVLGRLLAGAEESADWKAAPDLRLVRVGPAAPGPADRRAREAGLSDRLVPVGRVDDGELRELYALAEALLFPSLYEGFGLPPLEAVACGTRALAAPEAVAGGLARAAGVRTLPLDDPDRWAAEIRRRTDEWPDPRAAGALPRWEDASERVLRELRSVARGARAG